VRLKPVPPGYRPPYPDHLSRDEIHELLRPGLFRRFSPATMLAGALAAGAIAAGCDRSTGAPTRPAGAGGAPPATVRSTRTDARLKAEVDRIVDEVLGPARAELQRDDGFHLDLAPPLGSNPPLKRPVIETSYGTGLISVLDTEAAKEATRRLFAAYGVELRPNVTIKGEGYEFVADGYDAGRRIGFKLIVPGGHTRLADQRPVQGPIERVLEPAELPALGRAIKAGKVNVFVAEPSSSGYAYSGASLMQYYLASVVDYLNWVHGDRQIDFNRVFGRLPRGHRVRSWRDFPPLPGGDFEAEGDAARWAVAGGKVAPTEQWSSFGERGLLVELEPGGRLTYTPPDPQGIEARSDYLLFNCGLYCADPDAAGTKVTATLAGEDGLKCRFTATLGGQSLRFVREGEPDGPPPFRRLTKITFTTDSNRPLAFYIDDVGVQTEAFVEEQVRERAALLEAQRKAAEEADRRAKAEVAEQLRTTELPDFEFHDAPVREVLRFLADVTGMNYCVDWEAVRSVGGSAEGKFSSPGGRTRFERAMKQVLAAVGPGLEYRVDGRMIHISTPDRLDHPRQVMLPPRGADTSANEAATERLARSLPEANLDAAPLSDVIDFLADVTGVAIRTDWESLGRAGIPPGAIVDLRLRQVPADDFLRLVLEGVVGGDAVRATVWDGVLVISTEAALHDDAARPPEPVAPG
jgi:hypothetical protein